MKENSLIIIIVDKESSWKRMEPFSMELLKMISLSSEEMFYLFDYWLVKSIYSLLEELYNL